MKKKTQSYFLYSLGHLLYVLLQLDKNSSLVVDSLAKCSSFCVKAEDLMREG